MCFWLCWHMFFVAVPWASCVSLRLSISFSDLNDPPSVLFQIGSHVCLGASFPHRLPPCNALHGRRGDSSQVRCFCFFFLRFHGIFVVWVCRIRIPLGHRRFRCCRVILPCPLRRQRRRPPWRGAAAGPPVQVPTAHLRLRLPRHAAAPRVVSCTPAPPQLL